MSEHRARLERLDRAVYGFKMAVKYSDIVFKNAEYKKEDIDELMAHCLKKERYELCEVLKKFYKNEEQGQKT